jgi:hypothetical protein
MRNQSRANDGVAPDGGRVHINVSRLPGLRWAVIALMAGLISPAAAHAEDTLGGHFGFVLPLVTRAGGATVSIGDQFKIGFPIGITLKTGDRVAFDLELVPTIQRTPYVVTLTVEPGVLYALPNGFTAGIRMAFDVNQPSWGFTPLLHRTLTTVGSSPVFGELVVPIRFQDGNNSIGLAVHIGIGF